MKKSLILCAAVLVAAACFSPITEKAEAILIVVGDCGQHNNGLVPPIPPQPDCTEVWHIQVSQGTTIIHGDDLW